MRNIVDAEYKRALLADVVRRVAADGEHVARPHPDRARQFMPFAALKGYDAMAREKERTVEPRRAMTDERAQELSQVVAGLCKGDMVRVTHYEDGGYVETVGCVSEVVEACRMLRVVRKPIMFDDVFDVEQLGVSKLIGREG